MANITLLSWNIETFGPTKLNNANNGALINYIAQVIVNSNANIVSLLEINYNQSYTISDRIIAAVDIINNHIGNTNWRSIIANSNKNNEGYVLLYKTGQNFDVVRKLKRDSSGNGIIVHDLVTHDTNGNRLFFPSPMTTRGGRQPLYVAFKTTDTDNVFTVLAYHAMFGYTTSPLGVMNIAKSDVILKIDDGRVEIDVDASLISGDFNVDFQDSPEFYKNLLRLPSTAAIDAETTVKNNPMGGWNPDDYRESAYDNIFEKVAAGVAGTVTDLLVQSTVIPQGHGLPVGPGALSARMGAFDVAHVPARIRADAITNNPPQDLEDAWRLVREAVSNHYPVFTTVTI